MPREEWFGVGQVGIGHENTKGSATGATCKFHVLFSELDFEWRPANDPMTPGIVDVLSCKSCSVLNSKQNKRVTEWRT